MCTSWIVLGVVTCIAFKIVHLLVKQIHLKRIMPPGPPGLPLLGHIFQIPQFQWLRFTEWKEQYGPIFSLNFAGQPVVIINDLPTAVELLDRRSRVYSDRPQLIMVNEVLTQGLALSAIRYGDRWRRMRRAAHEGFSSRGSIAYQGLTLEESTILLSQLLHSPARWEDHVRRSIAVTVLRTVYDWPSRDNQTDSLIERIDQFMVRLLKAGLPGTYLVEFFPWMLHLPASIAKWKRDGLTWFYKDSKMFEDLLDGVATKAHTGNLSQCFSAKLIEGMEKFNLDRQESAWVAGILFGAAVDTTTSALSVFMLAMTLHPNVMRRAQEEIDAVIGRERMPSFEDRGKLPYIDAIIKEINRWRPPTPIGVPRCTTQDDWYNGYYIPKDTLVLLNVWAINHDARYFSDPETFCPERYLDTSGGPVDSLPDTHGLGHMTFGSGRRMCVGKDFAIQTLFIVIARILWAFKIEQTTGADGFPIVPSSTEFVDEALLVRPASFPCRIIPRSADVPKIIFAATAKAS